MHKILIALLILLSSSAYSAEVYSDYVDSLPIKDVTPGDVITSDKNIICQKDYTRSVRHVTWGMKKHVYESYGLENRNPTLWVIDHLIPLCAGGSNSVYNLWPQQKFTLWDDAKKDDLESVGCKAICEGKIDVQEFQREIATDWVAAYRKYVR